MVRVEGGDTIGVKRTLFVSSKEENSDVQNPYHSWKKEAGLWERIKWFAEVKNAIDQKFLDSYPPAPSSIQDLKNRMDQYTSTRSVDFDSYTRFKREEKEALHWIYKLFIDLVAALIEQFSLIDPINLPDDREVVHLGQFEYRENVYKVNAFYQKNNKSTSIQFEDTHGNQALRCEVGVSRWSSGEPSDWSVAEFDDSIPPLNHYKNCLKIKNSIEVELSENDQTIEDFYFKVLQSLIEIAQQNGKLQLEGVEFRVHPNNNSCPFQLLQRMGEAQFAFQSHQGDKCKTPSKPGAVCVPLRLCLPLKEESGWYQAIKNEPVLKPGRAVMPEFWEISPEEKGQSFFGK